MCTSYWNDWGRLGMHSGENCEFHKLLFLSRSALGRKHGRFCIETSKGSMSSNLPGTQKCFLEKSFFYWNFLEQFTRRIPRVKTCFASYKLASVLQQFRALAPRCWLEPSFGEFVAQSAIIRFFWAPANFFCSSTMSTSVKALRQLFRESGEHFSQPIDELVN